ncbi:MAG: 50S ribosomal protein L25 [Candidatus Dojkabacteria bacterium]|nr:MAG: 50S ribosomal protein L25 [Candidatus Dojkabacteria bacterium]
MATVNPFNKLHRTELLLIYRSSGTITTVMTKIKLEKRELKGKKTKQLRREGIIPAVIYDKTGNSTMVQGVLGDFVRILENATTTTVIEAELDGTVHKTFIKEIEKDPITDSVVHISFFEVNDKDIITYELPVALIGTSIAVKNNLGVLVQPTKTLHVRSTLSAMKPVLELDISGLEHPGQSINLSEIQLPEGVEFVQKDVEDKAIATITDLQKSVEEEIAEEAAAAAEAGEVVEGEEGAEGAAEAAPEGEAAAEE